MSDDDKKTIGHQLWERIYNFSVSSFQWKMHANNERRDYFESTAKTIVCDGVKAMTDNERLELFGGSCKHCGCDDPRCQCWNDE